MTRTDMLIMHGHMDTRAPFSTGAGACDTLGPVRQCGAWEAQGHAGLGVRGRRVRSVVTRSVSPLLVRVMDHHRTLYIEREMEGARTVVRYTGLLINLGAAFFFKSRHVTATSFALRRA
jgi:hypothetical protein